MKANNPYLVVIVIQAIYTGFYLLSKTAFDHGMNNFIFTFYRQFAATIFLLPFAFFQGKTAPPLSFLTFCKIFFLSFCGITLSLGTYGVALVYTSATLAAATSNCTPVTTFFLALLLRIEVLKLKTRPGIAKLVGIVACMGGAVMLAFYEGPHIELWRHHHILGHDSNITTQLKAHDHHDYQSHASRATWIKGCFLMLLANTFWALWLVLQGFVIKVYPSKLLLTTIQCLLSSIQSFAIAIAVERDIQQWKLGWNVRLLAVAYSGIMVTGVTFYLQAWVIDKKGPVFLAMTNPLAFIMTTISSAILLGEVIRLGSILGGFILVLGLYSVLWAKSREQNALKSCDLEQPSSPHTQLTNSHT